MPDRRETPPHQPQIAAAYVLPNGMVVAFDENGQAVAEYEGRLDEVEPRLREVSNVIIQEATWRDVDTL